jgi:STE24 endopeptidase
MHARSTGGPSLNRLLLVFIALRLVQLLVEHALAVLNRMYTLEPARQAEAARALRIPDEEMRRALDYAEDRYRFGRVTSGTEVFVTLTFLAMGGLGWVEAAARAIAGGLGLGVIGTGLAFFSLLGLLSVLLNLPFSLYSTFRIEAKHGFNRQTLRGFFFDLLKGMALGAALGGPLLAAVLWIMKTAGPAWWLWAWAAVSGFSLFTAWIYPTLLAPLFNKFTPLPPGELREGIETLATRLGFRTGGIFVMDASRRTAHGNAYFTGLFRQKRIVLFDTLLEAMGAREVLAVLAHELGHFKLHHVRLALVRGILATGVTLWLLSRALGLLPFYEAFSLRPTTYGALVIFGLWFSLLEFLLQPLWNAMSRRHEFAADTFAVRAGAAAADLREALLKLREKSRLLPLSHPLYSRVYHSHPPLLERLTALDPALRPEVA